MKARAKKANASRLASRKLMAFHRRHIGSTQGMKRGDVARAILALLKIDHTGGGSLKLSALAAIAQHEGSLPVVAIVVKSKPKPTVPLHSSKASFYESWEWATLRMKVLKANGGRCECCGVTAKDTTVGGNQVRLHVDHIEPISKHWHMRLERDNLQVLCAECNRGKGAWDETDWRRASQ